MGCAFLYAIEVRMYYGAFIRSFMKNRLKNGSIVGVNPFSEEWDVLARMLLAMSSTKEGTIGAGDYSGFDGSHSAQILWAVYAYIDRWYSRHDSEAVKMRYMLWLDVLNSKQLIGNEVYEWGSSLPSGSPMTIIINTLYNQVLFLYCWLRMKPADLTMEDFYQHVYLCCGGDDNVFSVHDRVKSWFNEMTLPDVMAEVGAKYTTELKGIATAASRKLSEVEFLKRSFRYDDDLGRWLAPLRLSVVLEICCWTKKGFQENSIAISNARESIRELSLHPKAIFDKYAPKIADLVHSEYANMEFPESKHLNYYKTQAETLLLDRCY